MTTRQTMCHCPVTGVTDYSTPEHSPLIGSMRDHETIRHSCHSVTEVTGASLCAPSCAYTRVRNARTMEPNQYPVTSVTGRLL